MSKARPEGGLGLDPRLADMFDDLERCLTRCVLSNTSQQSKWGECK